MRSDWLHDHSRMLIVRVPAPEEQLLRSDPQPCLSAACYRVVASKDSSVLSTMKCITSSQSQ